MSNDERPDSLAAQAAAWVPPWERAPRPPDREYQQQAEADARARAGELDDESGLSDDDFDPAFERADASPEWAEASAEAADAHGPAGGGGTVEAVKAQASEAGEGPAVEEPALSEPGDEATGVDAAVDAGEQESVEVAPGPELPLPGAVEDAVEAADADEPGTPVDAPLPPDGDDAGDVFDAAADDDVTDDGEMDLPFSEEVPPSGSDYDDDDDLSDEATAAAVAAAGDDEAESDEGGVDEPATGVRESAVDAGGTAAGGGHSVAGDGGEAGESVADEGKASGRKAGGRGRGSKAPGGDAGKVPGQKRRAGELGGIGDEASPRTGEEFDLPGLTEDAELAGALEAIMLVVDEPVAELQLAQILEQPTERIAAMLDNLSARYTAAGHGFDLRRVAGGWRLYTRPEYAAYVERFVLDGQSVRLTQAALETLAVVAYKQPVTRSRISAIRGVNCDGVMRTLATRGLIEECGTEGETGAHLYRTTGLFLEKLGLNSVDQLPPLAPFLPDDVEEVLDATG